MISAFLVMLVLLVGGAVGAQSHQIDLTNARLVVDGDRTVDIEVAMRGSDLDRAVGTRVVGAASGLVQPSALAASSAQIIAYIEAHTAVIGENGLMPARRRQRRTRRRRRRGAH